MSKVFMCEDGYNFWEPKSTTVAASLGMGGCEGEVVIGVLSITFFTGFMISAKPAKSGYFPTISYKTAIPLAYISSAFLIVHITPNNFATSLLFLASGSMLAF